MIIAEVIFAQKAAAAWSSYDRKRHDSFQASFCKQIRTHPTVSLSLCITSNMISGVAKQSVIW